MFDEPILRAEVKPKFSWLARLIIMLPIFLLLFFLIPVTQKSSGRYEMNEYTGNITLSSYCYNKFGDAVWTVEGTSNILNTGKVELSKIHLCINAKSFIKFKPWYIIATIYSIIPLWIFAFSVKKDLKSSALRLENDGLKGNKKDKFFDMPIQEIKDIKVKSEFIDFLVGGKTFEVITPSGVNCFRCIHNADELKAKTLGLKNKAS